MKYEEIHKPSELCEYIRENMENYDPVFACSWLNKNGRRAKIYVVNVDGQEDNYRSFIIYESKNHHDFCTFEPTLEDYTDRIKPWTTLDDAKTYIRCKTALEAASDPSKADPCRTEVHEVNVENLIVSEISFRERPKTFSLRRNAKR